MSERELVGGGINDLSPEDKEAANQAALALAKEARDTISEKYGKLNQEMLSNLSDEDLLNKLLEIADRGFVNYRLKVDTGSDWYGEWARNDPQSIAEYQMKGFIVDDRFAVNQGLHSDASGKPIVGDVIHMICPTRIKEAHDRVAKIRFDRIHGKRKHLEEEAAFESRIKDQGLDTKFKGKDINDSTNSRVGQQNILSQVKAAQAEALAKT